MSEKGQFGEPWVVQAGSADTQCFRARSAHCRAVACVNALDGMNPEALGEFVELYDKWHKLATERSEQPLKERCGDLSVLVARMGKAREALSECLSVAPSGQPCDAAKERLFAQEESDGE